ncbi:Predicted flavoprotein [gamma proteobacterium HdN1]|nr:Predicted flavoprotein [gamma proteobacterium HdN1]
MQTRGYDVVVIGAGAAGLQCAALAAQRGRRVLVLERSAKPGRKILMSGGGRCNFTNLDVTPANYLSENPHFCKSALSRYTQWDFIDLVAKHGVAWHEKKLGQLFCDHGAEDILNLLLKECEIAGVTIKTRCEIQELDGQDPFSILTSLGRFEADSVVIASGGLSIPSMGSTGFGYQVARQFGLNVLPQRAGLVPFTFSDAVGAMAKRLSGLSLEVVLENSRQSFREDLLFTHRGLSGPAVLQLSSWWREGESVTANLLPAIDATGWLQTCKREQPKSLLRSIISEHIPRKLVLELEAFWWPAFAETPLAEISNKNLDAIATKINAWQLKPAGTEGYRTAEVTLGGVDTKELSSRTMEATKKSGLFFIGEVIDVTGWLGGYNFQWAWSSAYAAAMAV